MLIQPYTHREAPARMPVDHAVFGHPITVYPLVLGDFIALNRKLRSEFLAPFDGADNKPDDISALLKTAPTLAFDTGPGRDLFVSSVPLLTEFVRRLVRGRPEWPVDRIRTAFFPQGSSQGAPIAVMELKARFSRIERSASQAAL